MRIFQILEASTNLAVRDNRVWLRNLHEPLLEMGHDVQLESSLAGREAMRRRDGRLRARFSQHILDSFRQHHAIKPFQLFFGYLMDGMIDPGVIDEIRAVGVPTCNFSCNNIHQFDLVDGLSPHFDYNLHSEKEVRSKFLEIGAEPLWWPMASNPRYFHPVDVPRTIPVSFVGANYSLRASFVAHLLDNGVDVHAYGPGWASGDLNPWRAILKRYWFATRSIVAISPTAQYRGSAKLAEIDMRRALSHRYPDNVHRPVSDDELVALYSRSDISLGFLEVYNQHDPSQQVKQHMHLRDFEAPMSGALYCTGYSDELAEMFEPDKELIVYRNRHELLDKVRFYLQNSRQADQIRQAGLERALNDHSYVHRFEQLFNALRLPAYGDE